MKVVRERSAMKQEAPTLQGRGSSHLIRKYWQETLIILFTNGFLLHEHPELPQSLKDNNVKLTISIHHGSTEYLSKLKNNLDMVKSWQQHYGIKVEFSPSYNHWYRMRKGVHKEILPYDEGDIRKSWLLCGAKKCSQLYYGKIWKCPPIAYLQNVKKNFNISSKWDKYLNYKPLDSNCSDQEIIDFFSKEEEDICNMCATTASSYNLPQPLIQLMF